MLSSFSITSLTGLAALSSTVSANYIAEKLSFGHYHPLAKDGKIADWETSSVNHQIQFLSDRMILTPPYPGNAGGSIWSNLPVNDDQWTAELEFRASGQDNGAGNLQIWYVSDKKRIDTNSAYTVEQFDGLVVVIDQYGHTGGKLRGFLNDGSTNFRAHPNMESLPFGSCDFSYRNLGRPSKVKLEHKNGLTVFVDDRECFRTTDVKLPKGNYFGITSRTSESPDSFEVNMFLVTTPSPDERVSNEPRSQQQQQNNQPNLQKLDRFPGSPEIIPDRDAEEIKSQADQFADVHNRLQGITHQLFNVITEIETLGRKVDSQKSDVISSMPAGVPQDMLNRMNSRLETMERTLTRVQGDIQSKDYQKQLNEMKQSIDAIQQAVLGGDLHASLGHIVSSSAPRMHTFVGIIIAVQVLLALSYVVYKRRRNGMPKKYL